MEYGLIGEKLGHSFSKMIHESIADYTYELKEISKDKIDEFMTAKDFKCINVTIPYKQTVIPYLDYISPEAKSIGAVNTIVNKNGKLYGYNTDYYGLKALIEKNKINIKNSNCLILGTGGTSKTAKALLADLGANNIYIASRNKTDETISYSDIEKLDNINFIINTTPCGMYPNNDGLILDVSKYKDVKATIDVIYNPLRTNFVINSLNNNVISEGGLYMLVGQAVYACEKFLDKEIDKAIIDKVFKKLLKEKQNIVLTGMPSSGKSTLSKRLSKSLKKEAFDTDDLIKEKIKMEISDYIKLNGEKAFRDIESEVVKEVSKKNGVIISTGGGVILRDENINNLKQNGKIVFINRDLELLKPTLDRPLSCDIESLKKRYVERMPIYKKTCDIEVLNNGLINDTINEIVRKTCEE